MNSVAKVIDVLSGLNPAGYERRAAPSSEATALVSLALLGAGRYDDATPGLRWLLDRQAMDGRVGIDAQRSSPSWPTGWAVLAWQGALELIGQSRALAALRPELNEAVDRAVGWAMHNETARESSDPYFGHNAELRGWSWVAKTHAWVEPTAMNVIALKVSGHGDSPRVREAVRLLLDRQLPNGGWNYGNTVVLGNTLRPNPQSTGIALVALAGEDEVQPLIQPSLDYIEAAIDHGTTPVSLAYGLLGATAHRLAIPKADSLIQRAWQHVLGHGASPLKLALVALAHQQLVALETGWSPWNTRPAEARR